MDMLEIASRIREQERLLVLEECHLWKVASHGLDESTARWVIDIRKREISKLKAVLERMQCDEPMLSPVPPPRRLKRQHHAHRTA